VAKKVLGIDIDCLKDLAGLHKKYKFASLSNKELLWGNVRVSDWTRESNASMVV
jgi:hypothetical protein